MKKRSNLLSNLSRTQRRTLADEIADQLRRAIRNGELAPEERLPENLLADALGVSRGPVREALAQLEREGLIVKEPNHSAVVARLSIEDLYEVFTLRLTLERLAIREAINKESQTCIDELQGIVDSIKRSGESTISEQEAADLDIRFHEALVNGSMHQRLLECWLTLKQQIYLVLLSRNVANPDFRDYAVRSHQTIIDSIRRGDREEASVVIEEHIQTSYERIMEAWGQHQLDRGGAR